MKTISGGPLKKLVVSEFDKVVTPGMIAKGQRASAAKGTKPADALSQSTRYSIARANDATEKLKDAQRTGDPYRISRAKGDAALAKADLERAKAGETATVLMKDALRNPIRIF